VVARVAVQLLARSDRRAGYMTRGRGLPCWARWKSERCAHLARLHAACMAARPFTHWSGRFGFFCPWPACMTRGTRPPRRRGRTLERVGEDSAHDGWGLK
jgi:hypothetical protein